MSKKKYLDEEIDSDVLGGENTLVSSDAGIAKFLTIAYANAGKPVVDFENPKEVEERVSCYFENCINYDVKPAVSGVANALGVSRVYLWQIKNGKRKVGNTEVQNIIKGVYRVLDEMYEYYMLHGKINPVVGIFLGKNNHEYEDKKDIVVTPNNPLDDVENPDDLRQKYIEGIVDDDE